MTLDELEIGEKARIVAITGEGAIRSRIMDFGLVPGTRLWMIRRAPGGGPFEIRVRGTLVSLRPEEARMIEVVPHRGGRGHHGGHCEKKGPKHGFLRKWFHDED